MQLLISGEVVTMHPIFFWVLTVALWHCGKAEYTAAVMEYSPIIGNSPNKTVEINLKEYVHYIEVARKSNVDIIVFPEYGLTGWYEDDPSGYAIEVPVNEGTKFEDFWLQELSNAAHEHSMYVVVNLVEKAKSNSNKTLYYNTNVIFDRKGNLIKKYRKINLYFEPKMTPGNEEVTFTTDFGVTFGIFTCFDIMFYRPSKSILNNATDIIFPTAWESILPFYHSMSIQLGYAVANKVNLLAANLNNPTKSGGGSGIYSADGLVERYYISAERSSKILISKVQSPLTKRQAESSFITFGFGILDNKTESGLSNYNTKYYLDDAKYQTKVLDLSKEYVAEKLCHGSFCCNIAVNVSLSEVNSTEIYQFVVFDGTTKYGGKESKLTLCTLLACETKEVKSCGTRRVNAKSRFRKISVSGHFENGPGHFYRPTSLKMDLLPVFNSTFTSNKLKVDVDDVTYSTTHAEENVIVFGIFARRNGATTIYISFIFVLTLFCIKNLF